MNPEVDCPDDWAERLLADRARRNAVTPSASFMRRCEDAALGARSVPALRAAAAKTGFELLTFGEYVQRVAFAAGVSLGVVLDFLGLGQSATPSRLDEVSREPVRLAVGMGVSLQQFLLHVRLSALGRAGVPVAQIVSQRPSSGGAGISVSELQGELDALEADLASDLVDELRAQEKLASQLYEDCSGDTT